MKGKVCSRGKFGPMLSAMILLVSLLPAPVFAQDVEHSGQSSYASPQQAVAALISAVQHEGDTELLAVLGSDSETLISSGDKVADRKGRSRFLRATTEKISIEPESEDRMTLLVGAKNYPFPIPIIRQGEQWRFDTRAGKEEILNRRIGGNELNTIEVMQAYTDAQREYACMKFNGDSPTFAQKFA
ncbi:MAG TPA: DUF2950 family protein, partial [Geopsychrobacteraceae bacterium]|nr:DUF2950 family protein [Geopsychrobacteraceae bacterium]